MLGKLVPPTLKLPSGWGICVLIGNALNVSKMWKYSVVGVDLDGLLRPSWPVPADWAFTTGMVAIDMTAKASRQMLLPRMKADSDASHIMPAVVRLKNQR